MDPITVVGTGLTVLGSKEILTKLLGPTADYLGNETQNLVIKCNINLENIFKIAMRKLGSRLDQGGTVSPRVLKHVYDDGRFCEDRLAAEYYGGILATSRSGINRDDRGVPLLAVIKDLSVYQLRFHYIVYSAVNRIFNGTSFNLGDRSDCRKMRVFLPNRVISKAMDFTATENADEILGHVLFGLGKHDLITNFTSGNLAFLKNKREQVPEGGAILEPTLLGAELYLWAVGLSGTSGRDICTVGVVELVDGIVIEDGCVSTEELRNQPPAQ